MTLNYSKDPKQAMAEYLTTLNKDKKKTILSQHFKALQSYARRALHIENALNPEEDRDREVRLREYLVIGRSFGLTDKQLVAHLFKDLFKNTRICDCPTCRAS